ncbi:hypothetical protein C8J57DRAFT_1464144 [Mycena rebaudengoi]|nr:hypothetical protein C8J57DRAFT_1464144 [Mycena rebaudengoi]
MPPVNETVVIGNPCQNSVMEKVGFDASSARRCTAADTGPDCRHAKIPRNWKQIALGFFRRCRSPETVKKTSPETVAGKCGPDCDVTALKKRHSEKRYKTRRIEPEEAGQEEPHHHSPPSARAGGVHLPPARTLSPQRTDNNPTDTPMDNGYFPIRARPAPRPCTGLCPARMRRLRLAGIRPSVPACASTPSPPLHSAYMSLRIRRLPSRARMTARGISVRACVGVADGGVPGDQDADIGWDMPVVPKDPALLSVLVSVARGASVRACVAVVDGGLLGEPDASNGGEPPNDPADPAPSMRATGVGYRPRRCKLRCRAGACGVGVDMDNDGDDVEDAGGRSGAADGPREGVAFGVCVGAADGVAVVDGGPRRSRPVNRQRRRRACVPKRPRAVHARYRRRLSVLVPWGSGWIRTKDGDGAEGRRGVEGGSRGRRTSKLAYGTTEYTAHPRDASPSASPVSLLARPRRSHERPLRQPHVLRFHRARHLPRYESAGVGATSHTTILHRLGRRRRRSTLSLHHKGFGADSVPLCGPPSTATTRAQPQRGGGVSIGIAEYRIREKEEDVSGAGRRAEQAEYDWDDKEDKWGGEGQMRMGGGGRVQAPDEMYGEGWAWARMGRWWSGVTELNEETKRETDARAQWNILERGHVCGEEREIVGKDGRKVKDWWRKTERMKTERDKGRATRDIPCRRARAQCPVVARVIETTPPEPNPFTFFISLSCLNLEPFVKRAAPRLSPAPPSSPSRPPYELQYSTRIPGVSSGGAIICGGDLKKASLGLFGRGGSWRDYVSSAGLFRPASAWVLASIVH